VPDRAEPTKNFQGGPSLRDVETLDPDTALFPQGPKDLAASEAAQAGYEPGDLIFGDLPEDGLGVCVR
jgi:hypothetical protein